MTAKLALRFTCYLCGRENVVTLNSSSHYSCLSCSAPFVLCMVPGGAL